MADHKRDKACDELQPEGFASPRRLSAMKRSGSSGIKDEHRSQSANSILLTWTVPPRNVLVIKKHRDSRATDKFFEIVLWLLDEKKMIVYAENGVTEDATLRDDGRFSGLISRLEILDTANIPKSDEKDIDIDFIICIGGDGTILYASSLFQAEVPPVISFHMGSLGFLMNFDASSFQTPIERMIAGRASATLRSRLECEFIKARQSVHCVSPSQQQSRRDSFSSSAHDTISALPSTENVFRILNEIVIDRGSSSYLSDLEVYCNGRHITTVQGDGLIIASSTGSTAYSLSAGGPMVHPTVNAILLTPVCAHSLSFRPIVMPDTVILLLVVSPHSRESVWVSLDGRNRHELNKGDAIRVRMSNSYVPTMNDIDDSADWFHSLSSCLNWNTRVHQRPFEGKL